ncbi:hypothetical protein KFE25_011125 [Diacronema lutheri]|uniref:Uncharacterized protein n=1 Tax=Diacronema lutheri TaxID=2081491 RepID=A0A8J5XAV3_DIALT|nr:hypothetical protein KFE25_011125 [Diacronema lutheri]
MATSDVLAAGRRPPSRSVAADVLAAGAGCLVADALFNPLEVLKVRLQLQPDAEPRLYRGLWHGLARIATDDGVLAGLWAPGLTATALRAFTYTGCRIGLYPSVRRALVGADVPAERAPLAARAAAGAATGGAASLAFCPLDVVRVRLQAEAGRLDPRGSGLLVTGLRAGHAPRYVSTLAAFRAIARTERGGARALWRGWHLTAARAAVLSSVQLSAYDTLKLAGKRHGGLREGTPLHVLCAFASGIAAQTAVQPVDTLRSRWMGTVAPPTAARARSAGVRAGASSGARTLPLPVRVRLVAAARALLGLYSGFAPAVLRQAPVQLVQMPAVEQFRRLLGLEHI